VNISRQFIAFVLVGALVAPAWSESNAVVGVALNSQKASVRGGALVTGSTVFSGDAISVDQNGEAKIGLAGGAQVDVLASSDATVTREQGAVQVTVERGSATFRSQPNVEVEAVMGDATIRALPGSSAVGVITVDSPESALVFADKNSLEIFTAHNSKTLLVPEGEAARLSLDPQQQGGNGGQTPPNTPPPAAKGSRFHLNWSRKTTFIVVALVAGGAVLTTGLIIAHDEKKIPPTTLINEVSPFQTK